MNSTPFQIEYLVNGQDTTDSTVDNWELDASRRALLNLKTLLFQQPMLDLLQPQIEAGDAYFRSLVASSNGQYRECRTDLKVTGITTAQIGQFRQTWSKTPIHEVGIKWLLPAHPEHYCLPHYTDGIVEVIGGHMARLRIITTDQVPGWVMEYRDPRYSMKKSSIGELDDGTVLCYILHEFTDMEYGCDVILRLLFPVAAPEVMFQEHAKHLAIEFRYWLTRIYEGQNGSSVEY